MTHHESDLRDQEPWPKTAMWLILIASCIATLSWIYRG